jgi:hypothetical protein
MEKVASKAGGAITFLLSLTKSTKSNTYSHGAQHRLVRPYRPCLRRITNAYFRGQLTRHIQQTQSYYIFLMTTMQKFKHLYDLLQHSTITVTSSTPIPLEVSATVWDRRAPNRSVSRSHNRIVGATSRGSIVSMAGEPVMRIREGF